MIQGLRDALAAAGLAAKVVYSGGVDVDVLAVGAGKGKGLAFLLEQMKEMGEYPTDGVQVRGGYEGVGVGEGEAARGCQG